MPLPQAPRSQPPPQPPAQPGIGVFAPRVGPPCTAKALNSFLTRFEPQASQETFSSADTSASNFFPQAEQVYS